MTKPETIYELYYGKSGTWWLVGVDENDIWSWDSTGKRELGLNGDSRTFHCRLFGKLYTFQLRGPWAANKDGLLQDTGVEL
jgi:hypothetical protein